MYMYMISLIFVLPYMDLHVNLKLEIYVLLFRTTNLLFNIKVMSASYKVEIDLFSSLSE